MSFLSPGFLSLLLILPLAAGAYLWALRRRKRIAVQYSSLALILEALPDRSDWRRHLPLMLFLLALASLILALARPITALRVPATNTTIILAMDVSLSMCSSDIPPNRLSVAQQAAETLIQNKEPGMQIGIVAFSGLAELVAPPTTDKEVLLKAVHNLRAGRRTAIGSAILRSIDAIAEIDEAVAPTNVFLSLDEDTFSPVQKGVFQPDIIVLLTDGASNRGTAPLDAAQAAVDRGLHIYTIGYGTEEGAPFICTPMQLAGIEFEEGFGGGFFGGGIAGASGGRFQRGLDEETLKQIAAITEAEYYLAESAEELLDVFAEIPSQLSTIKVTTEISAAFTGIGAILLLVAIGLSQRWRPLP